MSRGHALIAAAIVAAGLLVAIAVASSGESCDEWRKRYDTATVDQWAGVGSRRTTDLIRSQRPEGCAF